MIFSPLFHYFLLALAMGGSAAAFITCVRLFAPPPVVSETDLTKIAKKDVSITSSFSSLKSDGSLWDRLDLILLNFLHLDRRLEEWHMLLGRPAKPTALDLLHYKETAALFLGLFTGIGTGSVLLAVPLGILGFFIPDLIVSRRIRTRQEEMMRQFPTMVDLEALTIEAGLDYMTAFDRILKSSDKKNEFEKEIGRMLDEISLGYSRRDALRRLAMRTGLQEIRSFVGLIIQSDELGTSLVDLLRNYAMDMRFRRLNKVEKLAAQASTKMLIPLFIFIFPTVFVMMLAPMIKSLISGGLGF